MREKFSEIQFQADRPASWRSPGLRILLLIALTLGLWSCTPYAPAPRSGLEEAPLPESYSINDSLRYAGQRWWEAFDDRQLNTLIEEALSDNQTLAAFWARLQRAEALARRAGADLQPSLAGDAEASYARSETTGAGNVENENYSIGLFASYEVDLWGRIRAAHGAANLAAEASREDLNSAAMTVAAQVADRWTAILSQRLQKRLLEQQLATNRTYLDLG